MQERHIQYNFSLQLYFHLDTATSQNTAVLHLLKQL